MIENDKKNYEKNNTSFSFNIVKDRLAFIAILIMCGYIVILGRLINVTLRYNQNDIERETKTINFDAKKNKLRADIVDRNGNIIATSLPTVNVYANTSYIYKRNEAELKKLAKDIGIALNINNKEVLEKLKKRADFIYLKRNIVPKEQYETNKLGLPWIDFEESERRVYPGKNLFSHIVGAVDVDNNGVAGVEKEFDYYLKNDKKPLKLSLDVALQDTVRIILKKGIKEFKAKAGNAILMNVTNGEIISMVSLPDFDPNDYNNVKKEELFNRNTLGVYEAGSIFKIFNTAMYLNQGKSIKKIYDTQNPIKIGKFLIREYIRAKKDYDVTEIIIKSSNIGSARMALEIGGEKQKNFMKNLGFLDQTSIELPEKGKPLIPSRWGNDTQTIVATISYGYGLSVSPLHIVSATAGIVNNGKFKGSTIIKDKNQKERRLVSLKTSKQMRDLLRTVVIKGGGKRAYIDGYDVGGKTGSARRSIKGKYAKNELNTSFMAVFPIYNPKYALLVMLDKPEKKEGDRTNDAGLNSAVIAGRIIEKTAPQLRIIPKEMKR